MLLAKDQYPENCVRKAMYWLTETAKWTLEEDEDNWVIMILTNAEHELDVKAELHRLLNDFILREKLDKATKNNRMNIIQSSLLKIEQVKSE